MSRIPNITIDKQYAAIGVNTTHAQLQISMPQMSMKITAEPAQMEIERQPARFKINRKKVNSESGLKQAPELSRAFRDRGRAGSLRGARTAKEDGNYLGNLRNPGDRVGRLARSRTLSKMIEGKNINLGLMPQSGLEFEWDKPQMRVSWSRYSVMIDVEGDYIPSVTVDPRYSIEVYLRTKPYIRILVEDGENPFSLSRHVDKAV